MLLEHPHTFTFGRRGKADHLLWDEAELKRRGVSVYWVDRGGDVTYHGPGQLVGYPILPLPKEEAVGYLRKLEEVLILTLAILGLTAFQLRGLTGIWVNNHLHDPAKIASIGVKIDARGITRHGFALNVSPDMSYWQGIIACGLEGYPATCLADYLNPHPSLSEVMNILVPIFGEHFDYEMIEA